MSQLRAGAKCSVPPGMFHVRQYSVQAAGAGNGGARKPVGRGRTLFSESSVSYKGNPPKGVLDKLSQGLETPADRPTDGSLPREAAPVSGQSAAGARSVPATMELEVGTALREQMPPKAVVGLQLDCPEACHASPACIALRVSACHRRLRSGGVCRQQLAAQANGQTDSIIASASDARAA